jgi:transcription antitermination factor NusG
MLRPCDNPPPTWPAFERGFDLLATEWVAAYVKPRQEKALAWELLKRETPYFLPLVERVVTGGGRRRKSLLPLFPSYVFVGAGNDSARHTALKSERVISLIEPQGPAQLQFRNELAALEAALRSSPGAVELHPRLKVGTQARITAGPLRGFEGVVTSAGDKRKIWLAVSALGTGVTVEIHADFLALN